MAQKNWRILVVEDDPDGQEVVSTILEHLNVLFDVAAPSVRMSETTSPKRLG